jgi:hypothetical protein
MSFLNSHSGGWSPNGSTRHVGHWMAYCTCPGWLCRWRIWRNKDWQGKPKYSEKTCPSATLSTTNPTWPEPGANPGRRGGKPATNRLSHGAALPNVMVVTAICSEGQRKTMKTLKSAYLVSLPSFELRTFRIRVGSFTAWGNLLGIYFYNS